MDTLEAILTRRSVRKYADKPVPDEIVKQLLQAAMAAPSAANEQPWQFIVVREHKTLDQIPSFHPHSHMLKQAALAILVCEDTALEVYQGRGILDCSAATMNILLAAHAMALGAVWVGIYPVEERISAIRRLLGIPSQVNPISLVSIGYPVDKLPQEDRFKPERVHYERWMGHKSKTTERKEKK
jgi:nitroreductase